MTMAGRPTRSRTLTERIRRGPRQEGQTPSVEYVEMNPETARAAAMFALKQKSGHDTCSAACSGWELHTHLEHE
jgi:hypothetical protein